MTLIDSTDNLKCLKVNESAFIKDYMYNYISLATSHSTFLAWPVTSLTERTSAEE